MISSSRALKIVSKWFFEFEETSSLACRGGCWTDFRRPTREHEMESLRCHAKMRRKLLGELIIYSLRKFSDAKKKL